MTTPPLRRAAALFASLAAFTLAAPVVAQHSPVAPPGTDKAGFVWIRIPEGQFSLGTTAGDGDERPVRPVKLRGFSIAKTELTHAQWRAVAGSNHSSFAGCDQCPVAMVSWEEAGDFLEQASALLGEKLRLPTEAEWEYAARGGAVQQTWSGTNSVQEVANYAWFNQNAMRKAHQVCEKKPNLFGLCDMSGNLWEWCADWYDVAAYDLLPADGAAENPTGPEKGADRVLRGGAYSSIQAVVRATQRFPYWPGARTPYIGFRPVKSAP